MSTAPPAETAPTAAPAPATSPPAAAAPPHHHLSFVDAACAKLVSASSNSSSSLVFQVWREESYLRVDTTWLRRDPTYYRVYCIGLNTVFATLIPLVMLTFFNVSTVRALNRLGKQVIFKLNTSIHSCCPLSLKRQ